MRWLCAITLGLTGAAQAQSDITPQVNTVLQGHVAEGCQTGAGTFDAGFYARELTGNGLTDLLVDHGGITCSGGFGRSLFCGVQMCSVYFYVNDGQSLTLFHEMLGIVMTVSDTPLPLIGIAGHNSPVHQWRWNGSAFANIGQ